MATRKDFQMALDVVKAANIVNDLLDCASYQLQGIDPADGGTFMIKTETQPRETTAADLKDIVTKTKTMIDMYKNNMAKLDPVKLKAALGTFGIDDVEFSQEFDSMVAVGNQIVTTATAAKDLTALATVGKYIDSNVPKLGLLRRSWAL